MATFLESLSQAVTPQLAQEMSQTLGVEPERVTEGIHTAAPLVLAAVNERAATPQGAEEILAALEPSALSEPLDALESGQADAQLHWLFGLGVSKVTRWFENTTGLDVAPYLPVALTLVLNALSEYAREKNPDGAGLRQFVQAELETFAQAQPQRASEINAALAAGAQANERAARVRAQFSDDEWDTLAKTPVLAGYAVMMSSLSGPVGISKEIRALLEAMDEYGHQAEPDSLVGLISHEYNTAAHIGALGANRENAAALMRDACFAALRVLNEKETYDEKLAYKQFVVNVAARVATAAIDGGIMSIGGRLVSREEQQTLDLIAAALAYQP